VRCDRRLVYHFLLLAPWWGSTCICWCSVNFYVCYLMSVTLDDSGSYHVM
jgi:hypothetical protein